MRGHVSGFLSLAASFLLAACAGTQQYRLGTTGAGQALSRVTSDKAGEFSPSASPDGATLLFDTRFENDVTIIGVDPNSGARRTVYTGTNSRSLAPDWDPAGRYFVYSTNSPGVWSIVRSLSGSANAAVSVVVSGEVAPLASDPAVSPEGTRIAFSSFVRTNWQIATVNTDGSQFTLFGDGRDPAWSPDGRRLAFTRIVNGRSQVFTIDASTGTDVVQVTSGDFEAAFPSYSPDGQWLIFASNRGGRSTRNTYDIRENQVRGVYNLFMLRTNGTGMVQLTDGDGLAIMPFWARDGWIYFSSNQAGNFDIWRLRPSQAAQQGAPVAASPAPPAAARPDPTDAPRASIRTLGITLYAATPDRSGVRIVELQADGAAASAGLRPDDVIVGLEGSAVNHANDLAAAISSFRAGETISVRFRRGSAIQSVMVTLAGPRN